MADNELSGSVHGAALQIKNQYGGVTLYSQMTGQPGLVSVAVPERLVEHEIRGRAQILSELRPRSGLVVLCGAGGFGKTTVALALARELKADRPVWWVDASTAEGVLAGMREVALAAGAPSEDVKAAWQGEMSAPDLLWRTLERPAGPWLLVVDNADEPEFVRGWVRTPVRGLVVITSRDSRNPLWGKKTPILTVGALSDDDGAAVLLELAPEAGDTADAEQLARRLGGMPLALSIAGRLLEQTNRTPVVPGSDEPRTFTALLDQVAAVRSDEAVVRTWEISLDILERRGVQWARRLFRLLSFFGPAPVPTRLLDANEMARSEIFADVRPNDIARTLRELMDVGLIMSGHEKVGSVMLHPLVRETSRHQADAVRDAGDYKTLCARLLHVSLVPVDVRDLAIWPQWIMILPHSIYLADTVEETLEKRHLDAVDALLDQTNLILDQTFPVIAEVLRNLLSAALDMLGPKRPEELVAWHGMESAVDVDVYVDKEAEYRVKIAVCAAELGKGHRDTLAARHNLAQALQGQGKLAEAEDELRDALSAGAGMTPGPQVSITALRYSLAHVMWLRGDLAGAETETRSLLERDAVELGPDHSHLLVIRHRIACLVWMQGDHERAGEEFRGLWADRRRLSGAEDPLTLRTRHFAAFVVWSQGRLAEAEAEYWDLLADCESALGAGHYVTKAVADGLVELCEGSVPRRV